jgi:hypothetical protein
VALLYFQTKDDLTRWLKQHAAARRSGERHRVLHPQ